MRKIQMIEDFYKTKLSWVPADLQKGLGHFNVFNYDDFESTSKEPVPFTRSDYFKISLLQGKRKIYYADKIVETGDYALMISNPELPYKWELIDQDKPEGYCCIFTPDFFHQFGDFLKYPVFNPAIVPVFELTEEQAVYFEQLYKRMFDEIRSDYPFKYDALRTLVFEMVHCLMKIHPQSDNIIHHETGAARRITLKFLELLERQFPIENTERRFRLRSASDFASHLAVHVNHLNKALKETTDKTTTELIADRILQEAKILLKTTDWNVSEIAFALGFKEVTHFNNFFRKNASISPTRYRID